jgi:hypothetical protein
MNKYNKSPQPIIMANMWIVFLFFRFAGKLHLVGVNWHRWGMFCSIYSLMNCVRSSHIQELLRCACLCQRCVLSVRVPPRTLVLGQGSHWSPASVDFLAAPLGSRHPASSSLLICWNHIKSPNPLTALMNPQWLLTAKQSFFLSGYLE